MELLIYKNDYIELKQNRFTFTSSVLYYDTPTVSLVISVEVLTVVLTLIYLVRYRTEIRISTNISLTSTVLCQVIVPCLHQSRSQNVRYVCKFVSYRVREVKVSRRYE